MKIIAAADGSALGNPGPAGWGWYADPEHWACGGWPHGTNNMGELMAVLDLLQQTAHLDAELHILCDSKYVIDSVTKWMPGWKRNGWKKKDKKPVLNLDLMQAIDAAMRPGVTFEWVKGHAGHALNEQADRLANGAATAYQAGREPSPGPGFGRTGAEPDPVRAAAAGGPSPSAAPASAAPEQEPDLFSELDEDDIAGSAALPGSGDLTPVDAVIEAERALLSQRVRQDPDLVAELLHPEWTEIGQSGRLWTREEMLAEIAHLGDSALDLEVVASEQVDVDTVLLLWRARSASGARATLRSSVWVRSAGTWRQRFHQGTPEM